MNQLRRRLDRVEKRLGVGEEPDTIIIAGMEMSMDEFMELLEEIDGKSKGLPDRKEIEMAQRYGKYEEANRKNRKRIKP